MATATAVVATVVATAVAVIAGVACPGWRHLEALPRLNCSITGTKLARYCQVSFTIKTTAEIICCDAKKVQQQQLNLHRYLAVEAAAVAEIAAVAAAIDPSFGRGWGWEQAPPSADDEAARIAQAVAYTEHAATVTTGGTKC